MFISEEAIARLNIQHFIELLTTENDDSNRQTILLLLDEEEQKLKALENKRRPGAEKR